MSKRTIIIGDLHGCFQEAQELLEACAVTPEDRVIFTGDLVDRGPFPRECVELAMSYESILGNHEETHLRYRKKALPLSQMPPHHAQTVMCLVEKHWEFIERLPLYIRIPEHNTIVIHAGMWPKIPVEKQDKHHLLHLQCMGEHKKTSWPSKSPQGTFWSNYYEGNERVVFGHTGLNKPLHTERVVGIDTGCVFGRQLTAYILPDDRIVQVQSHGKYYGRKSHPVLGETDWETLIPIHGDVCTYS